MLYASFVFTSEQTQKVISVAKPRKKLTHGLNIPQDILSVHGIEIVSYGGGPALQFPYRDTNGVVQGYRYFAVDPQNHSSIIPVGWKRKKASLPFGAWQLDQWDEAEFIFIVSSAVAKLQLDAMGCPALAIDDGNDLVAISEHDKFGMPPLMFYRSWDRSGKPHPAEAASEHLPNTRIFLVPRFKKDIYELWQNGQGALWHGYSLFLDNDNCIYHPKGTQPAKTGKLRSKCTRLISTKDLSVPFKDALTRLGFAGETHYAWILYIIFTSRLFERPLSVSIHGSSSSGKSFLVSTLQKFMPKSAYTLVTTISDASLFYSGKELMRQMLIVHEDVGVAKKSLEDLIRIMLSENVLIHQTTEPAKGGGRQKVKIEAEFQTGLITTSTKLKIHEENQTRMLRFDLRDDPVRTKEVLKAKAEVGYTLEEDWVLFQQYLEQQTVDVHIPFEDDIAENMSPYAGRVLRDKSKVMTFIMVHAFLHQEHRVKDKDGRIVATQDDYKACYCLLNPILSQLAEESVPKQQRNIIECVKVLTETEGSKGWVSQTDIADALGVRKHQISRKIQLCFEKGWLVKKGVENRGAQKISIGEPLDVDSSVLPDPAFLEKADKNGDIK
jgi:hypothetical protein